MGTISNSAQSLEQSLGLILWEGQGDAGTEDLADMFLPVGRQFGDEMIGNPVGTLGVVLFLLWV